MQYEFDLTEAEALEAKRVLDPKGFRILIALPKVKEKIGSLYMPETRQADEQVAVIMGFVLSMGDVAYEDKTKFPTGAWCAAGDTILIGSYTGRRVKIGEREYRLINDDSVVAVVNDHTKISRAV
jgi:co-chaperonin GroES (HSP10)